MRATRAGFARVWPALAAAAATLVACTDAQMTADGADVERSGVATMTDVRFHDVASEIGIESRHSAFRWDSGADPMAMMSGGLCWIDVDRDGWLDLFVVDTWSDGEWGEWRREGAIPTSRLYRNEAGRFSDATTDSDAGVEARGTGCVAADLDLDGWTDLLVTTERQDVLLWNDGGDGFIDDASLDEPSGLATYGWHAGAAIGDVDGNGWPDVFVAGYTDMNRPIPSASIGFPRTFEAEPDLLFLNDGPGDGARARFREVAASVGIEPNGPDYGLGAILSDLDRDGDLDLYVANDTTPNQLYDNRRVGSDGLPQFDEVGVSAGVGDDGAGMGVAAADIDDDGYPELVTTNQLDEHHMLVRNATASSATLRFDDLRSPAGVPDLGAGLTGWGTSWSDFDLDGDLDLAIANGAIPVSDVVADREPMTVYEDVSGRGSGPELRDVSDLVGLDEVGPLLGRGLAAADYDNDGDIDLAVGTIGGPTGLLRNTGAGGHWLIVAPPTPMPGALVTVELADGRTLERELFAGSSYLSSEDPRAHFGLGDQSESIVVRVELADGRTLELDDVAADRIVVIDPEEAR